MAITKRPKQTAKQDEGKIAKFIAAAPDGAANTTNTKEPRKGLMRGKREQISLTIPPALLERLDERADKVGMTRAGFINHAIAQALEGN